MVKSAASNIYSRVKNKLSVPISLPAGAAVNNNLTDSTANSNTNSDSNSNGISNSNTSTTMGASKIAVFISNKMGGRPPPSKKSPAPSRATSSRSPKVGDTAKKKMEETECVVVRVHNKGSMKKKGDNRGHARVKRTVNFSVVQIREYDVVVGDHPSCTEGLSLGIGWNYDVERTQKMDDFENIRLAARRPAEDLILTAKERKDKLSKDGGYTEKQLFLAQRRILVKEREDFFTVDDG